MYFLVQSEIRKKLLLSRDSDPLLHLIEIFRQCLASGCRQPILGSRHAPFEKLHAGYVLRFFQLARMHAEIPVRCLEHPLEIVKAQRIVRRQRTDNPEPDPLVNQAIQFRKFGCLRCSVLANLFASVFTARFVLQTLVL